MLELSSSSNEAMNALLVGIVATIVLVLWRLGWRLLWRPKAIEAVLRAQGIHGPPRKLLAGNMLQVMSLRRARTQSDLKTDCHDIVEHVLPDYVQWTKLYGKRYVYWWMREPRIIVSEPELIREVLSKKTVEFEKSPTMQVGLARFLGGGILTLNAEKWSQHRRVVTPAFHVEKLKAMVGTMGKCFAALVEIWDKKIVSEPELDITGDLAVMTSDVISHTAFSSSYLKGKRVFELLNLIISAVEIQDRYDWIPFFRFLPHPANLKLRKLQNELNGLLLGMIKQRRELVKRGKCDSYGEDLLGLIIKQSEKELDEQPNHFDDWSLVGECKTFYLAGQETTATLLSWAIYLLALYPEWQEKARDEVLQACGSSPGELQHEMIAKLKLVGMIINETLRLYPPVSIFFRGALQDTRLGELFIPKGAAVSFPVVALHHDPELWGPDVNEFNPLRFKDGVANACKHPNAFMPFSFGPRICVGQAFAVLEAKVGIATILQHYRIRLSSQHRHNPTIRLTTKPVHGIKVVLEKIQQ